MAKEHNEFRDPIHGFIVLTSDERKVVNRRTTGRLKEIFPSTDPTDAEHRYWRSVVRMAALCHDLGHIPFSHGAEELLPKDTHHENLSVEVIRSPQMQKLWTP